MNNEESIEKIIEILKEGALKFHDDFDKNLKYYFTQEIKEDEIVVRFTIWYGRELEYLIIFKKQKLETNYIPDLKGYQKLNLSSNPYKALKFTDENEILGNIYECLKKINIDEIACYEKFGIILRNPLNLIGIYNINIKYITD